MEYKLEIQPFEGTKKTFQGMSYGLTAAGYDIRIGKIGQPNAKQEYAERVVLHPGEFILAASLERFKLPHDLQAIVHDKSSWARRGLALQNTVLEPGWEGYITLELSNHGNEKITVMSGQPIAQVVFHQLDIPTNVPYAGKYQNQSDKPTGAIHEE